MSPLGTLPLPHLRLLIESARNLGILDQHLPGHDHPDLTAGNALLTEHRAAQTALGGDVRDAPDSYTPNATQLTGWEEDMVAIVKATHTYQQRTAASPTWHHSLAQRLTNDLVLAATRHLPRYNVLPDVVDADTTEVIGCSTNREILSHTFGLGIRWMESTAQLHRHWASASLILADLEATATFPGTLSPHPALLLLTCDSLGPAQWDILTQARRWEPQALVALPLGLPWLRDQITAHQPVTLDVTAS